MTTTKRKPTAKQLQALAKGRAKRAKAVKSRRTTSKNCLNGDYIIEDGQRITMNDYDLQSIKYAFGKTFYDSALWDILDDNFSSKTVKRILIKYMKEQGITLAYLQKEGISQYMHY